MEKTEEVLTRIHTACFTGHRFLPEAEMSRIMEQTACEIARAYGEGFNRFICGGAIGFDTLAAKEVIRFRLEHPDVILMIAVPCQNQSERWAKKDKLEYRNILNQADEVFVLSDRYYEGCMQARNRFMVDHSSLCFCYMTRFEGGTWTTVRYAMHQHLSVRNVAIRRDSTGVMKEYPWNSIYISRFAKGNANTVRLFRFRLKKVKRINMSRRCLKRQD